MMITINPAPEMYTPFPIALSSLFIARTSLRSSFFSEALRSDLSDFLISSNLSSNSFALAASAGVTGLGASIGGVVTFGLAFNSSGMNANDITVAIRQRTIFFIFFDLCKYY